MNKTFTVAGTSVKNGTTKIRWAQTLKRQAALEKDGQTDVILVELPQAMSKEDAVKYIGTLDAFNTVEQQTVIAEYLAEHEAEQVVDTDAVEEHNDEQSDSVEEHEVA